MTYPVTEHVSHIADSGAFPGLLVMMILSAIHVVSSWLPCHNSWMDHIPNEASRIVGGENVATLSSSTGCRVNIPDTCLTS